MLKITSHPPGAVISRPQTCLPGTVAVNLQRTCHQIGAVKTRTCHQLGAVALGLWLTHHLLGAMATRPQRICHQLRLVLLMTSCLPGAEIKVLPQLLGATLVISMGAVLPWILSLHSWDSCRPHIRVKYTVRFLGKQFRVRQYLAYQGEGGGREAKYPPPAKKLPKIRKKREKLGKKRGKIGKKRQKWGRFFHFTPSAREGWLHY